MLNFLSDGHGHSFRSEASQPLLWPLLMISYLSSGFLQSESEHYISLEPNWLFGLAGGGRPTPQLKADILIQRCFFFASMAPFIRSGINVIIELINAMSSQSAVYSIHILAPFAANRMSPSRCHGIVNPKTARSASKVLYRMSAQKAEGKILFNPAQ
jgi:hypothetical protein